MSSTTSPDTCDSTCIGLAVGLSLLFFLLGCFLIFHFRDRILLKSVKAKKKETAPPAPSYEKDLEAGEVTKNPPEYSSIPEPESEEVINQRLQAELLEKKLKELEEEHTQLKEKSKKLQAEIIHLTNLNNDMALDAT